MSIEGKYREKLPKIIKYITDNNIINDDHPSIEIIQLDLLKYRIEDLKSGFGSNTKCKFNFAFAIKANPFTELLKIFKENGCGAECASFSEVLQSLHSGFEPSQIIYDSPCKTITELKESIKLGVCINADNIDEIERINNIFIKYPELLNNFKGTIGLRINPQCRVGTITQTSTATKTSQFGVPLDDNLKDIEEVYNKYSWLTGVHLHMGSQGISIDLLLEGIKKLHIFVLNINTKLNNKIKIFDIGGGLPIEFNNGNDLYPYTRYYNELINNIPNFFNGDLIIYTEFGNSLITKCGSIITKVEYVKNCGGVNTIICHIGIQFQNRALMSGSSMSEITLFDNNGLVKNGNRVNYRIVGPLCFSGDILKADVSLVEAKADDILLIHDIGSYGHSWYVILNSIPRPPVYGFYEENNELKYKMIYKGEISKDTLSLWE